jgi:hypothetical protein
MPGGKRLQAITLWPRMVSCVDFKVLLNCRQKPPLPSAFNPARHNRNQRDDLCDLRASKGPTRSARSTSANSVLRLFETKADTEEILARGKIFAAHEEVNELYNVLIPRFDLPAISVYSTLESNKGAVR